MAQMQAVGTGTVTDLKCPEEAKSVTNRIRKEQHVRDDAQASGLATGQIIIQIMGFREKKGLQGAEQVRIQVQLETDLTLKSLWHSGPASC